MALKLDAQWEVDLYFLCPGNGRINTEMVSKINGLDSVIVKFDTKSDTRLAGTLVGGEGHCEATQAPYKYCTQESDYLFDAPIVR